VKGSIKEEPPRPDWRIKVDESKAIDFFWDVCQIRRFIMIVPAGVFGSGS
jgi:hypothetical protein